MRRAICLVGLLSLAAPAFGQVSDTATAAALHKQMQLTEQLVTEADRVIASWKQKVEDTVAYARKCGNAPGCWDAAPVAGSIEGPAEAK